MTLIAGAFALTAMASVYARSPARDGISGADGRRRERRCEYPDVLIAMHSRVAGLATEHTGRSKDMDRHDDDVSSQAIRLCGIPQEISMKTRHLTLTLVCAAVLTALAASPVMAQSTTTSDTSTTSTTTNQESTRLSGEFSTFAGSDTNSQALVSGLRDGTAITLTQVTQNADGTSTSTDTTIQPVTGKMGYGNVKIALSLAEASLAKAGITDPTAAEIAAALNGGTLTLADGTTVDLQGVLAARASGEGWGQIANSMGFKLGELMRSPQAAGAGAQADAHAQAGVDAHAQASASGDFGKSQITDHPTGDNSDFGKSQITDHPTGMSGLDRPQVPEHPVLPDRPQIPARPQIPERPQIPDHAGRPGG